MITCNLREKRFLVDFISGRALREIEPALKMYTRIAGVTGAALEAKPVEDDTSIADALDVLVRWFCLLFSNQFTVDELYDCYPADHRGADRIPYDGSEGADSALTLPEFIYSTYNELLDAGWRMTDIDHMDMIGFLRLRAWRAILEKQKTTPKRRFIDEVMAAESVISTAVLNREVPSL